jgi:glycosyltransferase involved in cell wall biosynthesis
MRRDYPNVGIVTFPIYDSGITPLSNLTSILGPFSRHIHLITGNAGYAFFKGNSQIRTYRIDHKEGTNAFSRVIRYVWTQLRYSPILIGLAKDVDLLIFFMGGQDLLIPMLISKLLGKNVVLVFEGSAVEIRKARKDFFFKPLSLLVKTNCILSNKIVVYSERLVKEYGLEKHRSKILVAPRHFLDFNKFKVEKQLSKRDNLVGFIGRLYEERGILEFTRAIPKILEEREEATFLIGGDGPLRSSIEKYIDKKRLSRKIRVTGWIRHEKLPTYMNELKLLVLPSCTEGLPNIMLEAMACGTPVLATPVGGIPDVIRDGHTGFLMKNNSPQCIAENTIRALEHPNLEDIADNAKALVEREFTYQTARERYRRILNLVLQR